MGHRVQTQDICLFPYPILPFWKFWNTCDLKCLNKIQLLIGSFLWPLAKPYHSLEELSEALLRREVDGILIDAYAGGTQKHLFSKPSVRVARVIDHQTAYGVVIGGDSMRLRHCFYGYMRSHQAEIFKWVEELVEPIKVRFKQGISFRLPDHWCLGTGTSRK